jgi:HEAT repeat protein
MKALMIGIATLVGAMIAVYLLRRNELLPTSRAMKQAARDPEYLADVAERLRRKREVELPSNIHEGMIREWVERLLDEQDQGMVFPRQKLELVGARAEPFLLAVLNDSRYRRKDADANDWSDTPYETVIELLAAIGSKDLIVHLTPMIESPDDDERKLAALNIAHVGSEAAIPLVLRALGDADEYVRSYAIMGIGRAIKAGHASPVFRDRMFEALTPLAAGEAERDEGDAVECLVEIDRDRALAMLQTDRFLNVRNRELLGVLTTLNKNNVQIDAGRLWPILARAKSTPEKYPWKWIYAEVLVMLASQPDDRIEREINEALHSEVDRVREGAAKALLRTKGLPEPSSLSSAVNRLGFEGASKPEQHVTAIMDLDAEVNNGGYSQYFFNCAGDRWPIAIESAKTIGAVHLAAQLERAIAVFGTRPSLDRSRRIKQYGRLSDEIENALDDLSSEYYKDADRLDVLLASYMIRHKDAIRGRRSSSEGD